MIEPSSDHSRSTSRVPKTGRWGADQRSLVASDSLAKRPDTRSGYGVNDLGLAQGRAGRTDAWHAAPPLESSPLSSAPRLPALAGGGSNPRSILRASTASGRIDDWEWSGGAITSRHPSSFSSSVVSRRRLNSLVPPGSGQSPSSEGTLAADSFDRVRQTPSPKVGGLGSASATVRGGLAREEGVLAA